MVVLQRLDERWRKKKPSAAPAKDAIPEPAAADK
jgi:hypothetical protein